MKNSLILYRLRFTYAVYFLRRYFSRHVVSKLGVLCALLQMGTVYAAPPRAHELPMGSQVAAGSANISQNLNTLNVQQNTNRLVTDWQTFNIGSEATVNFLQPNANSVALNRVLTEGASQVYGRLNANGQVFLVNPSGVFFSSESRIDVGGLVASTLGISNENFLSGNSVFENAGNGSVSNSGSLSAKEGGYIALMAKSVVNSGSINTNSGTTALAAGDKVRLDFLGNQLLNMSVDQGLVDALIENSAMISAADGTVYMSAKAANAISRSVVNTTGVVEATGISEKGGRIFLTAEGGDVNLDNTLNVSSMNAKGGEVLVSGEAITLSSNTEVNASGATGGGEVFIGGDWQGSGNLPQATQVTMQQGASIDASATDYGDGGTVVLWSDIRNINSVTSVQGDISARGGVNGGDGGAVETSGHQVDTSMLTVDAGADAGTGGLWLIDPYNYDIDATAAGNISSTLNTGTSVTVTTTVDDAATGSLGGDGSDVGDITVNSAITKTAGGDATLTLKADRNVNVKESITSTSNKLNLVFWADQDGSGYGGINFEDQTNLALAMDVTTNGGHLWLGGGGGTTTWNGLTVGDGVAFGGAGGPMSGIQFVETTSISTGGGSIYMAADTSDALQIDTRFGIRTPTSIDAGGGDIELLGDKITFANTSTLETSGELTIASIGTSFDETFFLDGTVTGGDLVGAGSLAGLTINNVGSLGGLTLGKDGNATDIAVSSELDINGSVNIYGGDVSTLADWDIAGSVNIDGDEIITSGVWNVGEDVSIVGDAEFLTVGDSINTTDGDVLLKNTGTIELEANVAIVTLGGDITLWSDSDTNDAGYVSLSDNVTLDTRTATDRVNNTHTSGGGDITLAGGLDTDSDSRPDGFAISDTDSAIALGTSGGNTTTLYSGGGDLLIRGMGLADAIPTNHNIGVEAFGFLQADSGTGSISIIGESADSTGVFFSRSKSSGDVLDLKSSATSGTAISIVGTATGTTGGGVNFTHDSSIKTLQATGGGDIVITGSGAGTSRGIVLFSSRVLASSGDILIDGGVNGSDIYNSTLGALAGTDVLSSSSNLTVTGDSFTTFGTSTFDTTGTVTFDSFSDSFSGLYDDVNVGIAFADTISGLTIGKASNTADVTLRTDVNIAGPVTVYGGDITIENLINTEGGGTAGDILLKASGNVVVNETLTFETSGGDITLWSDSDANDAGNVLLNDNVTLDTRTATDRVNNTHTSGGGDITLAGGLDTDSDSRPDGFAVSDTDSAIALGTSGGNTTTLYSGGGDLLIRGMGLADAIPTNHNIGVEAFGFLQADSGTGSISIIGESADSTGVFFSRSKSSGDVLDLKSSATSGTAISIVGTATGSDGAGVNFTHDTSIKSLQATGGGDIEIIGTGAGSQKGIRLLNTRVLTSSGDILLDSGVNGMDFTLSTIGALAGTDVLSSSSNITVTGDSLVARGGSSLDTTGTVTFDSFSDSFDGLYDDINDGIAFADTISGLTIGKASNTADVTLSTDVDIDGPVTVYGGDITIENLINTEGGGAAGDILLKASGNVVVNASLAFDTNGGDITLWSDSDANDAGNVLLNDNVTLDTRTATDRVNNTHTSGGGDITLAGGLDTDSDSRPDGFAVSDTDSAIALGTSGGNTTTLYSGGGDLLIRGMGLADAIPTNHNIGVEAFGFLQADSGTGSISIIGESADSTGVFFSRSKSSGDVLDLKSSATSGTAISIVGTATGSDGAGVNFTHDTSIKSLQATGGGDIEIIGTGAGSQKGIKLLNTRVLTSSGDILLDSGVNGMDFTLSTIGALAGTDVLSSSSNITVTGDSLVARGGSSLDTTGTVTFDSFSDSFDGLYDDINEGIAFADTISGLTIGKASNTADVTLSTDVDIDGPVTVYGGDITIENLINTEGGGAAGDILLKASGTVVVDASLAFDTNGGDITLWSDSDANEAGNVVLNDNVTLDSRTAMDRANNTHTSGGGDITLAGGLDTDSDGRPDEFSVTDDGYGVALGSSSANTTTMYSGGGDLSIRGNGIPGASLTSYGILVPGQLIADSGTGTISIVGESSESTGILFGWELASGEALNLKSSATSGTAISIVGTATGVYGLGVYIPGSTTDTLQATGGGDIEIIGTGSGASAPRGVRLDDARVLTSSGDILIDGGVNGIHLADVTLGQLAGTEVPSSSSNITITGDSVAASAGSLVDTTGTVTFDSFSDSFDGLYDVLDTSITFADTVSGLTIGKASNTADVTLSTDVDIDGPVTVYGGDITIENLINTEGGGTAGDILLKASGNVVVDETLAFDTNGGDITLWSDSDANEAGNVVLNDNVTLDSRTAMDRANNTHTSGGGDITLAGGLDTDSDGRPDGFSVTSTLDGVRLGVDGATNTTTMYSGGGDLSIRGKGLDSVSDYSIGVSSTGALIADSGTGAISIVGESANTIGVIFSRDRTSGLGAELRSSAPSGSAISISGKAHGLGGYGVWFHNSGATKTLLATGGGDIEIFGRGTGSQYGIAMVGTSVLASSGDIVFDSGVSGLGDWRLITLGALAGSEVVSSTSDITIVGDVFTVATVSAINTSGTVTVEPLSDNFNGTVTLDSNLTFADTISGLTIGKASNSGDVTINTDVVVDGPVTVYGGSLFFGNPVTSTALDGTIALNSSGAITQGSSSAFTAANLNITTDDSSSGTSSADVTLINDGNNIATLTADVDGFLAYRNSGALSISRDTTNGITAHETILVETLTGDLTINDNIITDDSSAFAVILNAGKSSAAGTSTGGNIIVNSSPTVTVGSGGRVTLYSGDIDDSTGLDSLVPSTSGRFRYNSDEVASNFTSALGSGTYAIFRERPSVVVNAVSETLSYGTAPAKLVELSGVLNGDTLAQVFSTEPTVTVGGSISNSGNYTVGVHSLTASGAESQLGYDFSYTGGSLTVTPKVIGTSLLADNREYNGTSNATFSASGNGVEVGDLISITGSGTFEDKNVGVGKLVNITSLSIGGADASNYVLDSTAGVSSASITQKNLTVSGITAANKIYDGTLTAVTDSSSALFTGLIAGDEVSFSSVTGVFADKNVGSDKPVTLSSSYAGVDAGNYSITDQTNASADITPKAITVSGITVDNKVYDGVTSATTSGAGILFAGLLSGDELSLQSTSGTFSDKNVGTGKVVTLNNAYTGADVGNYSISDQASTTADITPKALTVSGITAANKIYDGTLTAVTDSSSALFTGLIAGDEFSFSSVTGVFADKSVGSDKPVTLSSSYAGVDAGNYSITDQTNASADITPKAITVSGITVDNKVYDGVTSATTNGAGILFAGLLSGDELSLQSTSGTFSDKNVGTGKAVTLNNAYTGADIGNYSITDQTNASADITPKAITVSGITVDNKVYDGVTSATTSGAGILFAGLLSGDELSLQSTSGTFSDKNVGTGKAVTLNNAYTGADIGNYSITDQASTTADITPKALTVSGITAANKIYDGSAIASIDASQVAIGGVVQGDNVRLESSTGAFYDKNAGAGKAVLLSNTYAGDNLANYSISDQEFTTADISQKLLTVSGISASDKVYDGTVAASLTYFDVVYEGLLAGDDLALGLVTGVFGDASAGELKTASISSTYQGVDVANYDISTQQFATASIDKKLLRVSANDHLILEGDFAYQGGNGASYDGFVAGESSSVLSGTLEFSGSSQGAVGAGSYDIVPSGLSSINYEVAFVDGQLVIFSTSDISIDSGNLQKMNEKRFSAAHYPENLSNRYQDQVLNVGKIYSRSCSKAESCTSVGGVCVQSVAAVCK